MGHANYWLVGLAFVLGLLMTFALRIRRVKREVPVRSSAGAAAAGTAETETTKTPAADSSESKEESKQEPGNGNEK